MKRKLLRQTLNEWRPNLWLVIELLIVSVIVWFITDWLYVHYSVRNEPTGFDAEHVYRVDFKRLTPSSSRYVAYAEEEADERNAADLRTLVNAIRQRQDVEAVSLSNNAEPYSQGFYGTLVWNDMDSTRINVNKRMMSPEHIRVVGYSPADPSVSVDEMIGQFQPGTLLITDFQKGSRFSNNPDATATGLVGRMFHFYNDSITNWRVAGVMTPVKRTSIESNMYVSAFIIIDENTTDILDATTINVRVRPEAERDFVRSFNAERQQSYRIGNTYVSNITSYGSVLSDSDRDSLVEMRKYVAVMLFMLVSVFLGLLGTFWFRTQQRVGEIAIRKVNGATNRSVFIRLLGEGMLLLVIATVPAVFFDWLLTTYEFNEKYLGGYFVAGRFIATTAITFLLMSLMIVGGIWFPARRAMKVDPARALADE